MEEKEISERNRDGGGKASCRGKRNNSFCK